jgi:nicotinamidase/pyrazinamidase
MVIKENTDIIITKGTLERTDSYSAFGKNPEKTGLKQKLDELDVKILYIVGLAYDYCVGATAIDSTSNGFSTYLIRDACRSVNKDTEEEMATKLKDYGVKEITSDEL